MTPAPSPHQLLFGTREERARARQFYLRDTAMGVLNSGLHHGLRLLSTDRCSDFGAAASRLSPLRYAASDARARRNWKRLRPGDADDASVDAAMRRLWRNVGRTMAEYSVLDRMWAEGRIAVDGREHLDALLSADTPILVASLHLGNWETIPVTGLGLGLYGSAFYMVPENRFEHRIAVQARRRFGGRMFPATRASAVSAMRELREGRGPFVIYVDELAKGQIMGPALGRPLRTDGNLGNAVRLAKLTGAAILPAYCTRLGDGARFKVTVLPPLPLIDTGDNKADLIANVEALNGVVEPVVRDNLDQWYYLLDVELEP